MTIDHQMYLKDDERELLMTTGATAIFLPSQFAQMRLLDRTIWFLRFWVKYRSMQIEPDRCYTVTKNWGIHPLNLTSRTALQRRARRQRALA